MNSEDVAIVAATKTEAQAHAKWLERTDPDKRALMEAKIAEYEAKRNPISMSNIEPGE